MTIEDMFWDVWRNVTSGTSGWSFGGGNSNKGQPSSKSAHRTRYNRLKSSSGNYNNGGPTKSISQPANLTSLSSINPYSSSESLYEEDDDRNGAAASDVGGTPTGKCMESSLTSSNITPKGNSFSISGRKRPTGNRSSSMKHSISSFFPFIACTSNSNTTDNSSNSIGGTNNTTASSHAAVLLPSSKNSQGTGEHEAATTPPTTSTSSSTLMMMTEQKNVSLSIPDDDDGSNIRLSPNICSTIGISSNGGNNMIRLQSPIEDKNMSSSSIESSNLVDHFKPGKDELLSPANPGILCEDDISDLDDDVEHLTCDVCDRAFPTLKQLAAHQRKKRHYGCLQCDSIFPSREVLEYHREQMSHYDYVIDVYEERDDGDFLESEDDENGLKEEENDEERERLLGTF